MKRGQEALAAKKVGVLILAGGMATFRRRGEGGGPVLGEQTFLGLKLAGAARLPTPRST